MNKYVAYLRFFGLAIFLFACGGGSSTAVGTGSDGGDGGGGSRVDSGHIDGGGKDGGGKDSGKDGGHVGDGGHLGDGGQVGDSGHDGGGPVGDSGHDSGPTTFTIGGTVVGLAGTGLVLQDNSGDNLTVTASGTFTFATPVAPGGAFSVTVLTQPSTPTQTCTVTGGTGTVGSADVTSVMVNCGTDYVIGGTISGLAGASVVLQDNGGDNLTVTANGTFAFATPVETGGAYAVTVLTQPSMPTQTCTVSTGSGSVASANVTTVSVVCVTNTYTVGGTVSGLTGSGLVLQDNGGDSLMVTASGTFTFATSVASGGAYAATVMTNPAMPSQTCVVTNGAGTVTDANITTVTVTCTTNTYTVGGMVTGLAATDNLVLQDNAGDNLTVTASGAFTFATSVASGAPYAVTILSASGVTAQTCTVSGGSGTIGAGDVTSVAINCTTNKYTIGGTASGLVGKGLVLQDNAGDNLSVTANGAFSFATPIASDATYAVTILTQPTTPSQTCVLASASGTVAAANVTTVTVTCTTNTYTVGGTLSGLAATESVVLQDNAANNLTVSANGAFTFTTPISSASPYAVTVLTNPASPSQNCVVTAGAGTVTNANITSVVVTCSTDTCPAETTNNCVLTTTNSGSSDTGTCAANYTGACSYSCNLGVWTQVTNTCVTSCFSPAKLPVTLTGTTFNSFGNYTFTSSGDLLAIIGGPAYSLYLINHTTGALTVMNPSLPSQEFVSIAYLASNNTVYLGSGSNGQIYAFNLTTLAAATQLVNLGSITSINALQFAPPTFGAFGGELCACTYTGSIMCVNTTTAAVTTAASGLDECSNMVFQSTGVAYTADYNGGKIYKVAGNGTSSVWLTYAGIDGLAIDEGRGRLYMADSNAEKLHYANLTTAAVTDFAGTYDFDGGYWPSALVFDSCSTLIIATDPVPTVVSAVAVP